MYLYLTNITSGTNVVTPTIPTIISIKRLNIRSNKDILSFDVAINNCPSKSCTSDEKVIVPFTFGKYLTASTLP